MKFQRFRDLGMSPRQEGAAIMAKFLTWFGTLGWGALVLDDPSSLPASPYGPMLLQIAPADVWGWIAAWIGGCAGYRFLRRSHPGLIGCGLYALMMLMWCSIAVYVWLLPVRLPGMTIACTLAAVITAVAAWYSPYRRHRMRGQDECRG